MIRNIPFLYSSFSSSSLVQRAYEMVLSIIFSQSTILLTSPSVRPMDKQLLLRELTAELVSFCFIFTHHTAISHCLQHELISFS